jgi:hypothetical protein
VVPDLERSWEYPDLVILPLTIDHQALQPVHPAAEPLDASRRIELKFVLLREIRRWRDWHGRKNWSSRYAIEDLLPESMVGNHDN